MDTVRLIRFASISAVMMNQSWQGLHFFLSENDTLSIHFA
jgi:hypothetical protein